MSGSVNGNGNDSAGVNGYENENDNSSNEESVNVLEKHAEAAEVQSMSSIAANGHSGQEKQIHEHSGSVLSQDDDEEDDERNSDEDSGSAEDEEEEEPVLKYERFGASVHELLVKDSASALAVSLKYIAIGMHSGVVHVFDLAGTRIKSFRPHSASVLDMCFDSSSEFISTASVDGQIIVHSLVTQEAYAFDMKRPMRTVALEPEFSKRSTRAFVCAGMAGKLSLYEKGWLGHKETVLHSGEGPIWTASWRGNLIVWANDLGVKIYDTVSQTRIAYIDRPADSPRADLFKCNLHWEDDTTLLIAWADYIKVASVRPRPRATLSHISTTSSQPPLIVEITGIFQVDCMISGIAPHPTNTLVTSGMSSSSSLLIMAYIPPDTSFVDEATDDRAQQRRKSAERPELRIISRSGEELSSDALTLAGYQNYGCNDYSLLDLPTSQEEGKCYVILSPKSVILAKPRDQRDHIEWLVERQRYEEALDAIENTSVKGVNIAEIGKKYIEHLVGDGEYAKAAQLCPKVLCKDVKQWENWIFLFAKQRQLPAIIPYIPLESPKLDHLVYEMVLAHFLTFDREAFQRTIHDWPSNIYDIGTVIIAVQSELDRSPSPPQAEALILMDCLADLYISNRQFGKALAYCLRLRRPNVFTLISEHNLFADVRDQVLLLVEFDQELVQKQKKSNEDVVAQSQAIDLLVEHTHSIPVGRVVEQLKPRTYFLYLYLRALFEKEPIMASNYADSQVELYAEYAKERLLDFLRISSYYSLENAYKICKANDLVPEMVFLLGRMGNNKEALILIIERLGDVHRAIEFAKEQNDDDLWEDLLLYSETRPSFIRVLLENVGVEINPIRLIRRIKNGLEIPGLRAALIKILQDFNLQISLLEGCQKILQSDSMEMMDKLQNAQLEGFSGSSSSTCDVCGDLLSNNPLAIAFLCRHVVHLKCIRGAEGLSQRTDLVVNSRINSKIAVSALLRSRVTMTCPVCQKRDEGHRRT